MSLYDAFDGDLGQAPAGRNTSVNHTYAPGEVDDSRIAEAIEEYALTARPDVVRKNRAAGNPMKGDWQGKGAGLTVYESGKVCTRGFSL